MPAVNPEPSRKDIVFIQRDTTGTYYGETHISGSNLIIYVDSSGSINADKSSSFYTTFPPPLIPIIVGSTYPITSSWASNSNTASYVGGYTGTIQFKDNGLSQHTMSFSNGILTTYSTI